MPKSNMFYLVDLERSVSSGIMHYWRPRSIGYTTKLAEAGEYTEQYSDEVVNSDFDNYTVRVPVNTAGRIMNLMG